MVRFVSSLNGQASVFQPKPSQHTFHSLAREWLSLANAWTLLTLWLPLLLDVTGHLRRRQPQLTTCPSGTAIGRNEILGGEKCRRDQHAEPGGERKRAVRFHQGAEVGGEAGKLGTSSQLSADPRSD